MGNAQRVAKGLASIPGVKILTAQYSSTNDDGTVVLDFGTGGVQCYSAGFYTPLPGDYVRALQLDDLTLMLGPVTPRPAYGRVTATGSPKLTVKLPNDDTTSLPYVSTYSSPSVNDDVLISWADGGMVIGPVTEVPISDYLPPIVSGGGGPKAYTATFRATAAGSYGDGTYASGWWTGQVWCSDHNIGCWFFGTQIADTIPDNAQVTGISMQVNELSGSGSGATFGVSALTGPSGDPAPWAGQAPPIPVIFGQALAVGQAHAIATTGGGEHVYGPECLLTISWIA